VLTHELSITNQLSEDIGARFLGTPVQDYGPDSGLSYYNFVITMSVHLNYLLVVDIHTPMG
tara:strand:+ start:3904 stop:4086 length:183 start_codon:yes stop_codon:yes gene_type:complete